MNEKELKQLLQQPYERLTWEILLPSFFRKVEFFTSLHNVFSESETVKQGFQSGIIHLDDGKSLAIFDVEVHDRVKIVLNRKKLREIAAKHIDQNITHGALVFYHNKNQGDYRFSFIAKWSEIDMETGMLRKEETKPTRYTYLFGANQACTTAARQLLLLEAKKDSGVSNIETLTEAFSLEALNKDFYLDYRKASVSIIRNIYPKQVSDKLKAHQGTLNLLNRMMFVYFIQKKDWLMQNPDFLYSYWKEYKSTDAKPDSFHDKWLNKVFFRAFNGKAYSDPEIFKILPVKYHQAILDFPFLNGGLFTFNDDYDNFTLPDKSFEDIFDFLQRYNFTIIEDSEEEVNLEINPELLGKMYEGMINATDLDDVEAEHGIVYTERPEINFMTRRSFVEVLDKKLKGKYSRDFLYHLCFSNPGEKIELLKRYNADADELRQAIISITACDPACGSGSMLIGIIQLMIELLRCIDEYDGKLHTPKDDFLLKKKIISESIYGVDIKEWAVRIAELRFWLYMIAEAEFTTEELTQSPLLPNLDFKLRQGNSLLQQIGNIDLSFEGLFKNRKKTSGASRKLNDFIRKKKAFITNQNDSDTNYQRLKEEELFVFKTFLQELIIENQHEVKRLSKSDGQISIFGDEKKGNLFEERISQLESENEQLEKVLQSIKDTGRLPFSFDIDFMEIFLTRDDPGFDLVLGNPPYVRQEDVLPADDALELERLLKPENKEEKASINKAYKEKLSEKVYQTWPFLSTKVKTQIDGKNKTIPVYGNKVPGRSDLYVYFQLLCPALLNSNGTFCFIISNSWLDVEYGGFVQHFLLKHTQLYGVYDCTKRSFSAKINTIIYFHSALINTNLRTSDYKTLKPSSDIVRFIMNKFDYHQTSYAPFLIEQNHCLNNTFRSHYRIIVKSQRELFDEGYDNYSKLFWGDKWGSKWLYSPQIYFIIKERAPQLSRIKDLSIYTQRNTLEVFEYFIETNEDGYPFLNSSKQADFFKPQINNLIPKISFNSPLKDGYDRLKHVDIISNRFIAERFFFLEGGDFVVGDTFFIAKLKENLSKDYYLGLLNSTITYLFVEVTGRKNLGEGVLLFYGPEFRMLELIEVENQKKIERAYRSLSTRQIFSVFKELGFDNSITIRSQQPNPLPDRKALDDIIFDELGLTPEERNEVYWATAELVKQRLDKAGSR